MNITIELTRDEAKEIIKAHILKEVPVHTAGKDVFISNPYGGDFKVEIREAINE